MPGTVVLNQVPVELFDADGNTILVQNGVAIPANTKSLLVAGTDGSNARHVEMLSDSGVYRARTEAKLAVGDNAAGRMRLINSDNTKIVSVIDDITNSSNKRMLVEADIKPGATITTTSIGGSVSTESINEFLLNGTSKNMNVDGDPTPVIFSYDADSTDTIQIFGLRFVFTASSFDFTGDKFGQSYELTNGVLVRYTVNSGTSKDIYLFKTNEDFVRLSDFAISQAGNEDLMAGSLSFGGRTVLQGGSADKVEVLIRDDISTGVYAINYFTATLFGVVE